MRDGGTRPLLFLATCLGFAETTLGMLASFAGTNGTLAAVFALVSLGMALLALVAMYFRAPAFLTFSSQQALDLRVGQELRHNPDILSSHLESLQLRNVRGGRISGVALDADLEDDEFKYVVDELNQIQGEMRIYAR